MYVFLTSILLFLFLPFLYLVVTVDVEAAMTVHSQF